jgi:hypothetical protein
MLYRRNFLKGLATLSAFFALPKSEAKTKASNEDLILDKENIYTFQTRKLGQDTITIEQKNSVRELNTVFLDSGKLLSVSFVKSDKKNEDEMNSKHIYVFDSFASKQQYLAAKRNIFQSSKIS